MHIGFLWRRKHMMVIRYNRIPNKKAKGRYCISLSISCKMYWMVLENGEFKWSAPFRHGLGNFGRYVPLPLYKYILSHYYRSVFFISVKFWTCNCQVIVGNFFHIRFTHAFLAPYVNRERSFQTQTRSRSGDASGIPLPYGQDFYVREESLSQLKEGKYKIQFWINNEKVQKDFFTITYK